MRTWALMYLLIWIVFLGMLLVLFPVLGYDLSVGLHALIGVVVVVMTFLIFRQVRLTGCPNRIMRITRVTFSLALAAGVFGAILAILPQSVLTNSIQEVVKFIHFGFAVAIITQASASATAFDMWEEKEFLPASSPPSS